MTTTRRAEPFRYSLNPPIAASLEILSIDGQALPCKPAQIDLIDISKSGCRVRTELDLYASSHAIRILLHVCLNEEIRTLPGEIRWQKELEPPNHHYGLLLELNDEEKETLNIELRGMAAARRIIVK
ncbi:PilZ domain-containing protein [Paenibacillus timonensis]|uniref:PilZ domain-containing protein n=1 Tax=Paenibacillus timonensis TaxID=225915 RepID=A0ABW3SHI9_9BACL|nr:PilZ domain-containing protein [Paenibacillus timonensis]MCH1642723.1 PilZ domain-containing protein [Paenibacillus timonensis]